MPNFPNQELQRLYRSTAGGHRSWSDNRVRKGIRLADRTARSTLPKAVMSIPCCDRVARTDGWHRREVFVGNIWIQQKIQGRNGANEAALRFELLQVPGIQDIVFSRLAGTFDCYVYGIAPQTSSSLLDSVQQTINDHVAFPLTGSAIAPDLVGISLVTTLSVAASISPAASTERCDSPFLYSFSIRVPPLMDERLAQR